MTVGEKIKMLRKERNITQKQLAEKTGIAEITIRQYEAGLYSPKIEQLSKIANALDVSISSIKPLLDESELRLSRSWLFEKQLAFLGCSIEGDFEDAYMWIKYPDGTLEVSMEDIERLETANYEYLNFLLEELKRTRAKDFKKK